jgi:hypothetical protein
METATACSGFVSEVLREAQTPCLDPRLVSGRKSFMGSGLEPQSGSAFRLP